MYIFRDIFPALRVSLNLVWLPFAVLISNPALGDESIAEVFQENCSSAINLNCFNGQMTLSYDQTSVVNVPDASCLSNSDSNFLKNMWFNFSASGTNGYYFSASNSNVGINVYTGTCADLELYDCIESYDLSGSYWTNELLPAGDYFIQVLSEVEGETTETDILFGCFEPSGGNCNASIEFVNVANCVRASGFIDIAIGGNTNEESVSLELLVDGNLNFFNCVVYNGFWISTFQIQGETIEFISAYAGNSETGCSDDIIEEINLPTIDCNSGGLNIFKFLNQDPLFCNPPSAVVKMYQVGTSTLKHIFTVGFDELNESYVLTNPPIGVYDIFIKPLGSLQQGFDEVQVVQGAHTLVLGTIQKGDLNNSNSINIADVSILSGAFNSVEGDLNFNPEADFNCTGSINIADISIFGLNFNEVGDNPPND